MNIDGFSQEALDTVNEMLYAEGWENPLAGECGQKAKRKAAQKPRTPLQEEADKARAAARRGKNTMSSSTRSAAAKKAAQTRAKCKGGGSTTGKPTSSTSTTP